MRSRLRALAVSTAIGILALATGAAADTVGVVVTGESSMQASLASEFEGWLKKFGHKVIAAPLANDAINMLVDCLVIEDEGCARSVVEKHSKATGLVFARVDLQAGGAADRTVTVTAYWFHKGSKPLTERRFCQRCNDAALRATAEDLLGVMIKASKAGSATLELRSQPAGAKVTVDQKEVGVTPLDLEVVAGPHEVVISHAGDHETRFVECKPGQKLAVSVALRAPPPPPPSRLLPVATMVVGGGLIATGVVMIAIDQDKGRDQPRRIRDTAPGGVVLALVGALVAGGGYVWFRKTAPHESRPMALITRDQAVIGWSGQF